MMKMPSGWEDGQLLWVVDPAASHSSDLQAVFDDEDDDDDDWLEKDLSKELIFPRLSPLTQSVWLSLAT